MLLELNFSSGCVPRRRRPRFRSTHDTRDCTTLCLVLALMLCAARRRPRRPARSTGHHRQQRRRRSRRHGQGHRSGDRFVARNRDRRRRPLHLHLAQADHLRPGRRAERLPDLATHRPGAAGQPEPHHELRARARHPGGNRDGVGHIAARRRVVVHDQRSRRIETHRRIAAERPRCRDA